MPVLDKAHLDDKTFFLAHASLKGDISKYLNEFGLSLNLGYSFM
ncbi:MAG: hypothetical protein ACYCVH_08615 [Ignavibacteriaceae bacterium]